MNHIWIYRALDPPGQQAAHSHVCILVHEPQLDSVRTILSCPVPLTAPFPPSQPTIHRQHGAVFITPTRPHSWRWTWSCEHQLQVQVTESVNTNLLLSGELRNLRQWQLFIPVDPTILSFTETTTTNRCAPRTAGLLTFQQKKPRSAYFSVFVDWAVQTSPSAARLCVFFSCLYSSWRAAHPRRRTGRDVVVPRRSWQPVAIAIHQVG